MSKPKLANSKNGGGILDIKSKNAFTLIELLAIIVILAIIAVITVPIILNIIENSRMGAATDSAYGYKDAVNKWYVTKLQEDSQFQLASSYTISSDGKLGDIVIPISGDKPSAGELHYSNNELKGGCLVIGDYAVIFEGGNATSTTKGNCDEYEFSYGNILYGYKTYDMINDEETEILFGPSGYMATGQNIYLKYVFSNGEVSEDIEPETCLYDESYNSKELCLKKGDYETNIQKISEFYEYDTETWEQDTEHSNYWYKESSKNTMCFTDIYGSGLYCSNGKYDAETNEYGNETIKNQSPVMRCAFDGDDAYCGNW